MSGSLLNLETTSIEEILEKLYRKRNVILAEIKVFEKFHKDRFITVDWDTFKLLVQDLGNYVPYNSGLDKMDDYMTCAPDGDCCSRDCNVPAELMIFDTSDNLLHGQEGISSFIFCSLCMKDEYWKHELRGIIGMFDIQKH